MAVYLRQMRRGRDEATAKRIAAAHVAKKQQRERRRRRRTRALESLLQEPEVRSFLVDVEVEDLLDTVLGKLPPDERRVCELVGRLALTMPEVARAIGLGTPEARVTKARAFRRARRSVSPDNV